MNQDSYAGFIDSLRYKEGMAFFKAIVGFSQESFERREFNKKLWDKLYFLEKMVTQQRMLPEIMAIPNQVVKSWTHTETQIESV